MPHDPITAQYVIAIGFIILAAFASGLAAGLIIGSDRTMRALRKGGAK